jgi:hypothetical protein
MAALNVEQLKPGQKIRITHEVRVGQRSWPATVEGTVRDVNVLVTGLTVERGKDDFVGVPTVHFVKPNGELSSITVDERTKIEVIGEPA